MIIDLRIEPIEFPPEVIERLSCYVYVYYDPADGAPFYVGRGLGNRAFAHLDESGESDKLARIRDIRVRGQRPRIELLRYGLTEDQAALVEAAAIDLLGLGLGALTNRVRGHHRGTFGRVTARELVDEWMATPVTVTHPAVLITINQLYRSDMSATELYEATRGVWKLDRWRAARATLALAVVHGVVKEVYRPRAWHAAGTLPYVTRDAAELREAGRWEFAGAVADEATRQQYVRHSVRAQLGRGRQNPIRYVNV